MAGLSPDRRLLDLRGRGTRAAGRSGDAVSATAASPSTPTALQVDSVSRDQIRVSWTPPSSYPDGARQVVFRSSGANPSVPVAQVSLYVSYFTDWGLHPATTYRYHVALAAGQSMYGSNEVTATTNPDHAIPGAPHSLTATPVSRRQINLSWSDASNNETGFELERDEGAGFQHVVTLPCETTYWADASLNEQVNRGYRVRALGDAGPSDWSNLANATTLSADPVVTTSSRQHVGYQTLLIHGTDANDAITVRQDGPRVTIEANGQLLVRTGAYACLAVHGAGGDDQLVIAESVTARCNVYGGPGEDRLS